MNLWISIRPSRKRRFEIRSVWSTTEEKSKGFSSFCACFAERSVRLAGILTPSTLQPFENQSIENTSVPGLLLLWQTWNQPFCKRLSICNIQQGGCLVLGKPISGQDTPDDIHRLFLIRLVVLFQFKDRFDWFTKIPRNLQNQYSGGDVTTRLDGIDRLPTHSYGGGKLLLGDVLYRPLYFNGVFHFPSLLIAFIVKLNFKIYTRKYK